MSTALDSQLHSQPIDTIELTGVDGYQFAGDKATIERKCRFITLYREHGSILHASRLTPVNRKTIYRWMENDEQFAEAVADSKDECVEELETSVYKRAFTDSLLAMFYLKAHRHQYRDKVTVDIQAVNEEIAERMKQVRRLPEGLQTESMQIPPPSDELQKGLAASSLQLPVAADGDGSGDNQ